jgi:SAM-dependent methyltransferase
VYQRDIYDERYLGSGYDERSAIRVLTAESVALREAVGRALESLSERNVLSVLDFAYGTGRVTNEFAVAYPTGSVEGCHDLRVVAYDVSAVGLKKAATALVKLHGFDVDAPFTFEPDAAEVYVAGSVARLTKGVTVTVVFVHGSEDASPDVVRKVLTAANDDESFAVTTSWYSGIAHIPTAARREEFFRMLGEVTDARGELLVAPSVSGDLVELQAQWLERLKTGDIGDHPIERAGDVIYETELGQQNFYHVFGPDLFDLLQATCGPGQRCWLEAVRMPDEEFSSRAAEADNFRRVRDFNARLGRQPWQPEDYRQVHTALAVRSGHPGDAEREPEN